MTADELFMAVFMLIMVITVASVFNYTIPDVPEENLKDNERRRTDTNS